LTYVEVVDFESVGWCRQVLAINSSQLEERKRSPDRSHISPCAPVDLGRPDFLKHVETRR
jgi:hypothetical protein